jgi:LemA protein
MFLKTFRSILAVVFSGFAFLFLSLVTQDNQLETNNFLVSFVFLIIIPLVLGYVVSSKKVIYLAYISTVSLILLLFAKPFFWENAKPYIFQIIASTLIIIIVTIISNFIKQYNFLIKKDENIKQMLGNLEVVYQMRIDKISSLSDWANKYTTYEKNTFSDIVSLRNSYQQSTNSDQKIKIIDNLEKSFSGFMVNIENYPNLKSDQVFIEIMQKISSTEDEIVNKRTEYNNTVQSFNETVRTFPIVLFANSFNLKIQEYFKIDIIKLKSSVN